MAQLSSIQLGQNHLVLDQVARDWGLPIDPHRPLKGHSAPGVLIVYYEDEAMIGRNLTWKVGHKLIEGELVIPRLFYALWHGPGVFVTLTLEVRTELVCTSVLVRPDHDADRVRSLREIRLARLVEKSGDRAAIPQAADGTPLHDIESPSWTEAMRAGRHVPQRGKRLSDEQLEEVAVIYRDALERGMPPTATVAKSKHLARSTAGRWVLEARRRGFLEAAPGKRRAGIVPSGGGEHGERR